MRHAKVMAEQIFEIYDVLPSVGLMNSNNCCWFRAFENLGDRRSLNTNETVVLKLGSLRHPNTAPNAASMFGRNTVTLTA